MAIFGLSSLRIFHWAAGYTAGVGLGLTYVGKVAELHEAELAIISHHGPLSDADLSYAVLGSYTADHEISIEGPLREYYLRGAQDTPDQAEWRTEIGWPIFRADGGA